MAGKYEMHRHADPEFPVIFHLDTLSEGVGDFHWHESVEVLYCIEGEGTVFYDTERIMMTAGELVVINSNVLHVVTSPGHCRYYCLIAAKELFPAGDIPVGEVLLRPKLRDARAADYFDIITGELQERRPYYRTAVKAAVLELFTLLFRSYAEHQTEASGRRQNKQIEMTKAALEYIRSHLEETISIEEICRNIGFSKYYFCRTFREVTGYTVVGYLNFLRCSRARRLILSGRYNVSESAERCGYHNLSYFTRVYKAQMGKLPSEEKVQVYLPQL